MTLPTVSKPRHDPVTTISPIAEIIAEARNGKPFILVDADDRENEGDIIIPAQFATRSEEHTSELQSLMRISYAVFCLKKKKKQPKIIYILYRHHYTRNNSHNIYKHN